MPPTKNTAYSIDRLDQVQALVTPTRQEIVDALQVMGPSTVRELGISLGRAPDSLYHHLRILLGVGLVLEGEARRRGRFRESVYDLPGRPLHISYSLRPGRKRDALNNLIRSMSRIASRDFERATEHGNAVVRGSRRNLRGTRQKALLDSAQTKELNRLFSRIDEVLSATPSNSARARLHAVTIFMSPMEEK